jgi:hypothetical protein
VTGGAGAVGAKRVSVGPGGQRLEHRPDLSDAARSRTYGAFEFVGGAPAEIVAGAPTAFDLRYRAGERGLPAGAAVALLWRLPADWGAPQFDRPGAPNHVRVVGPDGAGGLVTTFDARGGVPPWNHLLAVTASGPGLAPGATLTLHCGDGPGGGPGWDAPTAALPDQRLVAAWRADATAPWVRLADLPPLRIVAGAATELEATAPSSCRPGEPFRIVVRGVDRWGNVSRGGAETPTLDGAGITLLGVEQLDWDDAPHDLWHLTVRIDPPGVVRPRIRWGARTTEANPVRCAIDGPAGALVWGDLHGGQGDLGVGQGSLDRYFAFADRVAGLQFTSHQANDVYVTQADWHHTRTVTERWHRPGAFVTLLGCEWTASVERGGDHNVVYRHDPPMLHRAQRWFEDPDDAWPDAPEPPDLYARLADVDALLALHVGGFTSDLDHHDERLQRLVEVHSTHATSRWFVADALERGYELGVVGGSDGIAGRPGACRPGRRQNRNLRSGATGAYVAALSRDGVWAALRERRCFATTGARIALWVEAEGAPMGSRLTCAGAPEVLVRVEGTAAIDRILLRRGGRVVAERRCAGPDAQHPDRFRLLWQGSRGRGAARHQRLDWAGRLTLSEGSLRPAGTVGFEVPTDGLEQPDPASVAWRSVTAGSEAGFLFDLEAPDDARLHFDHPPLAFDWDRAALERGVRLDLPHLLDGHLTCERARDGAAARDVEATLRPPPAPAGRHAYWVEVVQVDGARAWSSPLFVTIVPDAPARPAPDPTPRPTGRTPEAR